MIFQIGGFEGAAKIAELLRGEGVDAFDFVLDEGLMATDKIIPGVSKPVAL
jgi:carboxypeptidase PM20D1